MQNDTAKTKAAYQDFLALWQDADPDTEASESGIRETAMIACWLGMCGFSRFGWTVAGEYVDIGISGTIEKRPELDRLLGEAHRRRFDAVVVWRRFDRFARSVSHFLRALGTFKSLGIEFVTLSGQVDTSTPTGRMVFTLLGAVAELERSSIRAIVGEQLRLGEGTVRQTGRRVRQKQLILVP